jgi:aspartate racemase
MEGGFYPAIFDRYGISVHLPAPDDLSYVHERYVGELTQGEFRPATRQGIIQAIVRLRDRAQADGVILAGTELPLLLEGGTWTDVPLLDSTQAHVDKVARTLWS